MRIHRELNGTIQDTYIDEPKSVSFVLFDSKCGLGRENDVRRGVEGINAKLFERASSINQNVICLIVQIVVKVTIKLLHRCHIGPIDQNDDMFGQIEIVANVGIVLIVVDDESAIKAVGSLNATVSMIDVGARLVGHESVLEHRVRINGTLSNHC